MTSIALEIDQGDDEIIDVTVKNPDGQATNLTGCKLWFTVRQTPSGPIVLERSTDTDEGITVTNPAGGIAEVAITDTLTAALDSSLTGKTLRWQLQNRDQAGNITTLAKGTIVINRDIIIEIT
jgi:hypothetical protein